MASGSASSSSFSSQTRTSEIAKIIPHLPYSLKTYHKANFHLQRLRHYNRQLIKLSHIMTSNATSQLLDRMVADGKRNASAAEEFSMETANLVGKIRVWRRELGERLQRVERFVEVRYRGSASR
ncbi:MAG: hypothetical protein Q9218_001896 [Villophora microphyllina]